MLNICISGISSNSGKTILTTALLYHFKEIARGFKIGPDFIDPQFHKIITKRDSINLDSFIMNTDQVKWIFNHYKNDINILEGVMGFYDGEDRGCSSYSVSKLLNIPTILIIDGSGSYITISAILKGLLEYKKDNTIRGVVLNNLSSSAHYELIKKQILQDHPNILIFGWIKKELESLDNIHLGLDLNDLNKIKSISNSVLENIDISLFNNFIQTSDKNKLNKEYPFDILPKQNKHLCIINDQNFSFLYYDNVIFFKEIFSKVTIIDSTRDETIPKNADVVFISGGYVETKQSYEKVKDSNKFKNSLINHAKTKSIYGECAGLLYLGNKVDSKKMSGILDINFTLSKKRVRLGYYYDCSGRKGHAFHYTKSVNLNNGFCKLSKQLKGSGDVASWKTNKVYGTYFHTMFRTNIDLVKKYFLD